MKKPLLPALIGLSAMILLSGCIAFGTGDKSTTINQRPTVGQQLVDLQKAKNSGSITDSEYQAEKAKLLNQKP